MTVQLNWKIVGLGAAAAAGCLFFGYKLGRGLRGRPTQFSTKPVGKSHQNLDDSLHKYSSSINTCKENKALTELREFTKQHRYSRMATPVEMGNLLTILTKALNAKKVIDVGVFTGCSSFAMALGLPKGGKVIACDVNEEFTSLGMPYWEKGGILGKIELHLQPATKTLQELIDAGESGSFDMLLIDANKEDYVRYYNLGLTLLRKGGLIIVDNTLWSGKVADPAVNDDDTKGIRALNDAMKNDSRVDFTLLNLCDGVNIAIKL